MLEKLGCTAEVAGNGDSARPDLCIRSAFCVFVDLFISLCARGVDELRAPSLSPTRPDTTRSWSFGPRPRQSKMPRVSSESIAVKHGMFRVSSESIAGHDPASWSSLAWSAGTHAPAHTPMAAADVRDKAGIVRQWCTSPLSRRFSVVTVRRTAMRGVLDSGVPRRPPHNGTNTNGCGLGPGGAQGWRR